jgi:hypothetical protein
MSIRDDRLVWEGRYQRRRYLIIKAEPYYWTIENVLRSNGLSILRASSALGPTLTSLWASHVVAGVPWHGQAAGPGAVLFIRDAIIHAPLQFRNSVYPAYMLLLPRGQFFSYPKYPSQALNEFPVRPQLIVLDAFGDLLARGDNVLPTAAVPVCRDVLTVLREQTEAAILLFQRRPRIGSPTTFQGVDAIMEIRRSRGRPVLRNTAHLIIPPFGPIDLSADYAKWRLVSPKKRA